MNRQRRWFRLGLCWFLSFLLIYSQMGWAVQNSALASARAASTSAAGGSSIEGSVDAIFERMQQVRKRIDRSQFDLGELVFALEFDAEAIVKFVDEEIRYQPYDGLLRAAQGTLIARAGNSLDQSVLLAKLLNDAGFEARIAEGSLEGDAKASLLPGMFGALEWPELFADGNPSFVNQVVSFFAPELSRQDALAELARGVASEQAKQTERVDRVTAMLEQHLPAGLTSAARKVEALAAIPDRYFWTEYRLGPGDDWVQAHPAFAGSTSPEVTARRYFGDSIPAELQHRIGIEIFLESETAGSVQKHSLIPKWERPAANAAYTPLTIAFVPYTGADGNGSGLISEALERAELFVPYFSEQGGPSQNVFSLDGRVLPPEAMTAQGQFIKEVSDRGAEAVSALSALGGGSESDAETEPESPFKLGKLWIRYSMTAPTGAVKSIDRVIVEPEAELGPRPTEAEAEAAWKRELRARLMQMRSLTVVSGQTNPNFLSDRLTAAAAESRTILEAMRERRDADPNAPAYNMLQGLDPLPETLWMEYLTATNTSTGVSSNQATYLHEPMLVSFNRGVVDNDDELGSFRQIDILSNSRRSYQRDGANVAASPVASLRQGVYESVQEASVLQKDQFAQITSAFQGLEKADALQLITQDSGSAADLLANVPASYRSHAERELSAGYALLVPETPGEAAWWRVDPNTGSVAAMGFGPAGYGGVAATEYIKVLGLIVGGMFTMYNMIGCDSGMSLDVFCCLMGSFLIGVVTALFLMLTAKLILAGIAAGSASAAAPLAAGGAVLGEISYAYMQAVAALINLVHTGVYVRFLPMSEWRDLACGAITD